MGISHLFTRLGQLYRVCNPPGSCLGRTLAKAGRRSCAGRSANTEDGIRTTVASERISASSPRTITPPITIGAHDRHHRRGNLPPDPQDLIATEQRDEDAPSIAAR